MYYFLHKYINSLTDMINLSIEMSALKKANSNRKQIIIPFEGALWQAIYYA